MNERHLPLPKIADACQVRVAGVDLVWGITYEGYLFEVRIK